LTPARPREEDQRNLRWAERVQPAASDRNGGVAMRQVTRIGWAGLAVTGAAAGLGLALAAGSALAAGDWDLAPQPWIGIGMTLIVLGLAGGACFALLLDVVEPIGWWRLLAVPPALLVGGFWASVLLVGVSGPGGPELDVATALYTLPMLIAPLVVATVALALPAVVARRAGR
jgi:hypothetical protein